ncbi:MAG: signal peptide peptidase SppA [Geobacteraceae bacterium]|nr:signal peptide peptidase SppA [Geobacteraceae bacterium]
MNTKSLLIGLLIGIGVMLFCIATSVVMIFLVRSKGTLLTGNAIGVVEMKGMIVDSTEINNQLREFLENDRIKVVVLRVDSPGGVVGPSQEIYEEVRKFSAKKKLIVSMGSVAASGGYYISAPATMIYANPGTLTGSIGVLMKLTNVQGLLGKIGMSSFVLKSGKFKDSGSPVRPMTSEERQLFQGVIDSMHSQFVRAVAEGRKLPVSKISDLADGRVFTGEQALQAKLVDKIGNFQDAVDAAAKMAGIEGKPKLIYPEEKRKSLLSLLVEGTSDRIAEKLKIESGLKAVYEMPGGN